MVGYIYIQPWSPTGSLFVNRLLFHVLLDYCQAQVYTISVDIIFSICGHNIENIISLDIVFSIYGQYIEHGFLRELFDILNRLRESK